MQEKSAFDELQQAASDIGIDLQLHGQMPADGRIKDLVLTAAIEALNNALRHADATTLDLEIKENHAKYQILLTNNGKLPEGKIQEGGGLSTLRRKVEEVSGEMGIDLAPDFRLWITVPHREILGKEGESS